MPRNPAPPLLPEEYTTVELADHLKVSPDTVNRMILRGDFPGSYQLGKGRTAAWRIPVQTVKDYKAKQPQAPGKAA